MCAQSTGTSAVCVVCPHHCSIPEGGRGICGARSTVEGEVVPLNYGRITALALDPIEKKPLARFHPGTKILSVGSYGCNMLCPFCQNHDISRVDSSYIMERFWDQGRVFSPKDLVDAAQKERPQGNIGIAYTYNEPLVGYEFVRDTAKLASELGLVNVVVTNGCFTDVVLNEIEQYIDAYNIDLKCFTNEGYHSLGGSLKYVCLFIERAAKRAHVELTTLVVPGLSDDEFTMERQARWIASIDPDITLHLTRFFPAFHMSRAYPTDLQTMYRLQNIAERYLNHVVLGNV